MNMERLIIALMAILALLPGATAQAAVAGPKVAIFFRRGEPAPDAALDRP